MSTENTPLRGSQISRHVGQLGEAIHDFVQYACDPQDYRSGHSKRNKALAELERQTQWFHENNIPVKFDFKRGWASVVEEK